MLDEFEKSIEKQLDYCKELLTAKGQEYTAGKEDRLLVFKKAAVMQGVSPKEALAGMMVKHTVSIYDMSHGDYPIEKWEEKITDHINYLLLLKALIEEENHE